METPRSDVTDATAVRERLLDARRPALERALADAVAHAGGDLAAAPVADIPYLAVAGRGVVLRGPLAGGGRVVATLAAFEVDPYRRGPALPEALVVECRG